MKSEEQPSVSLEDLLRLKRAERPPQEFWADFDRRLREKQLSALVGSRPWWQGWDLGRVWSGVRRYQLPLGAAAIIGVTVLSVRLGDSQVSSGGGAVMTEIGVSVSPQPVASFAGGTDTQLGLGQDSGAAASIVGASVVSADAAALAAELPFNPAVVETLPRDIPLLGVPAEEVRDPAAAWAARYVESALGATAAAEPFVSRSLLGATSSRFEARAMPAKPAVEPLQQITPPAERRGARILAAMVSSATVENAKRATERAASRLSEEHLYDQIQRFGARGAGVSVKF